MANTTLTLLAAGSLRSAFLPLVAHFRQHTGLAVDAQFGPAGLLRERPAGLEVVLTGRNPPPELIELADYISEIKKVKHPFDKGIAARDGIER